MHKENEQMVENVITEIKKCLNENGIEEVTFSIGESGKLPECLDMFQLDLILSELTDNCKDCGAKKIAITIEEKAIRVEDDIIHENPEKIVKKLNDIRGSRMKDDPKKWQDILFNKVGGIGISEIVLGILENTHGSLQYFATDDNRIIAELVWPSST